MSQNLKSTVIFLSGVVVGAAGMYFALKGYFEEQADKEVNSVKNAYEDRLSEIEDDNKSTMDGGLNGPSEINESEDEAKKKAHKDLIHKLNNKPDIKDYTKFFKAKGETLDGVSETLRDAKEEATGEDPAEAESPGDDTPYTDKEDEDSQLEYEDYQLNGEHKKAMEENRKPYKIEASDYDLTCANYEKIELMYYISADILCDDSKEEVNPYDVIGDVLYESGFADDEEDSLFVRNDKLMCDFMVTKIYTAYES